MKTFDVNLHDAVNCNCTNLTEVHVEGTDSGHLFVTYVAFEVLSLLMLDENGFIVKFSVTIEAERLHRLLALHRSR